MKGVKWENVRWLSEGVTRLSMTTEGVARLSMLLQYCTVICPLSDIKNTYT
jgi:hypothetical protein